MVAQQRDRDQQAQIDSISIMSGGQYVGQVNGVMDHSQVYQSMINNNQQEMLTNQNVNDVSVLSCASQSLSFVQRQTNASQLHPGGIGGGNTNNSVLIGATNDQNVKRGKKGASNSGKTTAEPRGNVNVANAGRGLMSNGVLSSNLTQVGNFVG